MRLSLGVVLALGLAGLQFFAILIVVMTSYVSSERALLKHAHDLLDDVATNTTEHSRGFLKPARGAAELAKRLAENRIVSSENTDQLEKLLFQQLQTTPQFAGVFYGDEAGNFVYVMKTDGPGPFRSKIVTRDQSSRSTQLIWRGDRFNSVKQMPDPTDTFDPRERPWYKSAKASSQLTWTDPYIFFTSEEPGITVASPVFDDQGKMTGVIGVDIEIVAISGFLAQLKIGRAGKAMILNHNGDVIAHPDPTLIKTNDADGSLRFLGIDEINDPIARTAFGDYLQAGEVTIDGEVSSNFEYDGAEYVSTLQPIGDDPLPWTIAVYAPEDDFIDSIKANRAQNIGIAAIVAALTGVIGLLLAGRIHKPVRALALRATQISQGQYVPEEAFPKTFRELESANATMMRENARRKKSELEYGRTFDLTSRGMAQVSPDTGAFLRVNKRLADVLGYSEDELLSMSFEDVFHSSEIDDFPALHEAVAGKGEYQHERSCKRRDGRLIWVTLNAIMIHDENGLPQHTVVTIDDITEAKVADVQIKTLNNDLTHYARLNTMGEMAAGIAHELNQPLTAITQNADAALSTVGEDPQASTELKEILEEIDGQAHRAGDIIRTLRGFVRKEEPSRSEIDLAELIGQTVSLVRSEAKENNVKLRTGATDVPHIYGVRVQVAQVLVNLLRNAIESIASTQGAGKREVLIQAVPTDGKKVNLCIEDTGPGIAPDVDPFAQFETTKADGMGLGLSICRGIVEAHGGKLWFETTPEGTTRFCCSLPAGVQA